MSDLYPSCFTPKSLESDKPDFARALVLPDGELYFLDEDKDYDKTIFDRLFDDGMIRKLENDGLFSYECKTLPNAVDYARIGDRIIFYNNRIYVYGAITDLLAMCGLFDIFNKEKANENPS